MTGLFVTAIVLAISALGIAALRFPLFGHGEGRFPSAARRSPPACGWQARAVGDLATAEDLLDLLEARGSAERELAIHGNSSFEVRWR